MATQSFEEFQASLKKAAPAAPVKGSTSSKGTQSFQEFQDSLKKSKEKPVEKVPEKPAIPAPAQPSYTNPLLTKGLDIGFSSTGSTMMIPTQEQVAKTESVIKPVVETAKAVAARAKEMRTSDNTGARTIGAVADTAITTAKDLVTKLDTAAKKPSVTSALDFGVNAATLGLVDFVTGAAPEVLGAVAAAPISGMAPKAGEKVRDAVQYGTQKGMEFIFGQLLYESVGGAAVKGYEAAFGEQSPEVQAQIKSIATVGTMIAGFKIVGKVGDIRDARLTEMRDASGIVKPMGETLGLEVKTDKQGRPILPSEVKINEAYKASLNAAAEAGGPHMTMKMDAFDAARQMLYDYRNSNSSGFNAKWQPVFEQGSRLSDKIVANSEATINDSLITKSAEAVNRVITEPATKESLREARNLSEREQLAFEQEVVDMNAENDAKLAKTAEQAGYKYSRTEDPFDRRPAHFDTQTGEIVLNEAVIRDTLLQVWDDKVIRVGEGKLTTVFRKIKNETFEAMKTRYEKTLLQHEMAHAKTVTPEDAARLRAAIASGDKKAEARLRADLEEKASKYTVENASRLDESMNAKIDDGIKEYQTYKDTREQMDSMKYENTEKESSYQKWKKLAKRNPDYQNARFDELESSLSKRAAYKEPGAVKALFEDALAKGDGVGASSFDELLDEFRKRRASEERVLGEYKKTTEAQGKIDLESPKDKQTRDFIRKEIKAEAEKQALTGKNRNLEMDVLRQRISRRLEKQVMKDKFLDLEARLKGQKVNATEKVDTVKRQGDMRVLKENIKGRARKEALRGRMEAQKNEIRGRIATKAEAQQLIVDFMRENRVPKDVRVQAITGLKNAKNPKDVLNVLQEMRKNWNEFDRKQTVKDIRQIFKDNSPEANKSGLKEGKMTADAQRELNRIEEVSMLDRNTLNKQIVELVEDFRSKNPDTLELPDEIAEKMKILELGGLKGQTLQQLEATKDYIENLVETGRSARQAQLEEVKAKNQALVESAREYINGSTAEIDRTGTVQPDTMVARVKEQIKAFWRSGSILPELSAKLGPEVESLTKKSITKGDKATDESLSASTDLKNHMKSVYGDELGLTTQRMSEQKDLGTFTNANGGETKLVLTRGQALDLYMKLQDAKARQAIMEDNGFTPEMIDKALGLLTDADKSVGDYIIQNGYAKFHSGLAEAYEYTRGVPFGKTDRYSGHLRYEGDVEATPFLDQILMDVSNRRRIGSPEFVKSRQEGVQRKLVLSTDPIMDFVNYAKKASHYTNMVDIAPQWNAILTDKTIRDSIIEKYGKSAWESFEYHVKNQLRGGPEDIESAPGLKIFNKMSGNVSGVLVRRPEVVAGQFSSLAQFRAVAKKGSAFWRGVRNASEMKDMLYKYAPGVRTRASGSADQVLRDAMGERTTAGRVLKKVQDVTGKPLNMADEWTTLRGSAGLFNDRVEFYQKKGMSLEESRVKAGQDVDLHIIETQSTSNFSGKSQIELQPGFMQGFTNLRNQPNKVIHGNKLAFERFRKGKISGKELATYLYWNNVVQPTAYATLRYGTKAAKYGLIAGGLSAAGQDEAAKDQWKKFSSSSLGKETAASILNTSLTGSFLVGDMLEMVTNLAIFGKSYEVRPGVLQSVTADAFKAIQQLASGDIDEAGLITIRGITRAIGLPDPLDGLGIFLSVISRGNTEAKAELRKTPEYKKAAAAKRKATAAAKRNEK